MYRNRGVKFIGLTPEPRDELANVVAFISKHRTPWPTGYGAGGVMQALGANFLPWVVVVGRDGRVVWNSAAGGSVEAAIEQALADPRVK